jgi:hypothetical protein
MRFASKAALHDSRLRGNVSQEITKYLRSEVLVIGIAADQIPGVIAFVNRIIGDTLQLPR